MTGFATAVVVVNVSCILGSFGAAFFTLDLGRARETLSRGDPRLLAVISIAATLGIYTCVDRKPAIKREKSIKK